MTIKQEIKDYKSALKFQEKLKKYIEKTMQKTSDKIMMLERETPFAPAPTHVFGYELVELQEIIAFAKQHGWAIKRMQEEEK